jgi:hypothetical protein
MELNLKPGDCLLYSSHGPFGWFIRLKTWSDVSHVEVYLGGGKAFASRSEGVNVYEFKDKNLVYVLRPTGYIDLNLGNSWAETVRGRKYDWWGLLRFFRLGKWNINKLFCSEAATCYYFASKFLAFASHFCPGDISPGMFLSSPVFTLVWEEDNGKRRSETWAK